MDWTKKFNLFHSLFFNLKGKINFLIRQNYFALPLLAQRPLHATRQRVNISIFYIYYATTFCTSLSWNIRHHEKSPIMKNLLSWKIYRHETSPVIKKSPVMKLLRHETCSLLSHEKWSIMKHAPSWNMLCWETCSIMFFYRNICHHEQLNIVHPLGKNFFQQNFLHGDWGVP